MRQDHAKDLYGLYDSFIQNFLIEGNSILSNHKNILNSAILQDCFDRFVVKGIDGGENFDQKAKRQFENADINTKLVFAHAEWLWSFAAQDITVNKKKYYTTRTTSLDNEELKNVYPVGFGSTGVYFNQNKPNEITFILNILFFIRNLIENKGVKNVSIDEIKHWIENICLYSKYQSENKEYKLPTEFKEKIPKISFVMANILTYVGNPDKYERIASNGQKERVFKSFKHLLEKNNTDFTTLNLDEKILLIRKELANDYGDNFDFYDEKDIRAIWQSDKNEKSKVPGKQSNNKQNGDEREKTVKINLQIPLNQILYGPPGTGKTYNTILKAAQIITNNEDLRDYDEAKSIFNDKLHDKIEFITFHQNYSYEDFIQGLRPDTENEKELTFKKRDGVFMRIAINALFEYYKIYKNNQKNDKKSKGDTVDENEVYLDFIGNFKNSNSKEFSSSTGSKIFLQSITINDNIEFKHENRNRTYIVSRKRLLQLFKKFPVITMIKNIHNDIRIEIGGCNTTIYWVALKEFIDYYDNYQKETKIETEDLYEEIGYETKKKFLSTVPLESYKQIKDDSVPNYVIIIDEINRANISRVFGELITLIEPDKRSHGDIPLKTTLPSGDEFIVPSNLYIIGTMNTADKSIALLDIALRRRFEFEAMYPIDDREFVDVQNEKYKIHDYQTLQKINMKIIEKKSHDFQIGHSYFMGDNFDFVEVMNKKVIPLLLEYFMNSEKDVKEILNEIPKEAKVIIKSGVWPLQLVAE